MELDANQILANALRDGVREGVKEKLSRGYNSPLDKLIDNAIAAQRDELQDILDEGMASCVGDAAFRDELKSAVRSTLARTLVQRFGGELEKSVNALKSDPTTRAKITIAIEEILKSKGA